ncbi:radical SAM protein [Synergistales bacterium]|nr:radical SAM protein [Synergistales bacterium]
MERERERERERKTADPRKMPRVELYEHLPLDMPFTVQFLPSSKCNFRCSYCWQSLTDKQLEDINFRRNKMDLTLYKRAIDAFVAAGWSLRQIIFTGWGEPLTHPDIASMIKYTKERLKGCVVDLITNAVLLSPEISYALVSAGLDRLRVSIQGTSAEKYKEICGTEIDFSVFLRNLQWFYAHQGETKTYITIISAALEDDSDEKKFFDMFSPLGDIVDVRPIIPTESRIDYSKFGKSMDRTFSGYAYKNVKVCSRPFFEIIVDPDGDVLPCCLPNAKTLSFGSIKEQDIADIWNGDIRKKFLRQLLTDRTVNPICAKCQIPSYGLQPGDFLDDHASELLGKYS